MALLVPPGPGNTLAFQERPGTRRTRAVSEVSKITSKIT